MSEWLHVAVLQSPDNICLSPGPGWLQHRAGQGCAERASPAPGLASCREMAHVWSHDDADWSHRVPGSTVWIVHTHGDASDLRTAIETGAQALADGWADDEASHWGDHDNTEWLPFIRLSRVAIVGNRTEVEAGLERGGGAGQPDSRG